MTEFLAITDSLSVSPQIDTDDIARAAESGFAVIINNRPDGEEGGQPTNADLAEAAEASGIRWVHIPVVGGQLTIEGIEQMALALRDSSDRKDLKTLAFCRTGTRSCTLWGLAEAFTGGLGTDEILARGTKAGYDLSGMAPTLEHLHQNAGG